MQGRACRRALGLNVESFEEYAAPNIDWELYAWVCYSHRSEIIKAMDKPRSPAEIKKKARATNPWIRMSANNVRDVIRLFKKKGVVEEVWEHRRAHPLYKLTGIGEVLRQLLNRAGEPASPNQSKVN